MEFSALIDKLDDVVAKAKKARLSGDVRIDKDEASGIVNQLRHSIPEELTQAHWIVENREEMLAEARRETARILEEAREERARLLAGEEITEAAEQRAHQVVDDAVTSAREIVEGAEDYAGETLADLETYLLKIVEAVERGRERLGGNGDRAGSERVGERRGDPVVERKAALVA